MLIIGTICGLAAATGQSIGYLLSRRYLSAGGDGAALWIRAQMVMGLLALGPLLLWWRPPPVPAADLGLDLLLAAGGYLSAQLLLFVALARIVGSRLAPLLGIKIPILAGLLWLVQGQEIDGRQWAGIALAVLAVVAICRSGTRIGLPGLGLILGTAICYAVSDLGCAGVLGSYPERPRLVEIVWSVSAMHVLGAIALAPFLGLARRRDHQPFAASIPYAVTWATALLALFAAFAWLGVIPGVILQALRSPISVLLGYAVARLGHHHLEIPLTAGAMVRQLLAALLMVAAIVVYLTA